MRGPAETGNEHGSCPGPGVFLVTREGFSVTSFGLRDQPGQAGVLVFSLAQTIVHLSLMNKFSAIMEIRVIRVSNPKHQMATGKNRINWSGYSSFISFYMRKNQ